MPVRSFKVKGHQILVDLMADGLGKETVYYDGQEVSSQRSVLGGTHRFAVNEDGVEVNYEVRMKTSVGQFFGGMPKVELYRNGEKVS